MPTRARAVAAAVIAAAAVAAAPSVAHATAPGWSTPHTASALTDGSYAAGANGQGAQLFGTGGAPTRTAQMRAIKQDATQGTAVGVNAGAPGFDLEDLSVNDSGNLIGAWSIDTEGISTNVNIGVGLGSRTSLPRTATVLPSGALIAELQTAIDTNGTGVVAWIQSTPAGQSVQAATLQPGQAPIIAQLIVYPASLEVLNLSVGFDGSHHPVVTWSSAPETAPGPGTIGVARGNGQGAFAPAVQTQIDTAALAGLQTFVTSDGGLLAFWYTPGFGSGTGPQTVRFSQAGATGPFSAPQTLVTGVASGLPTFAANASGRAAVLFPLTSGNGTSLRVILRTSGGTWGGVRPIGPSGARRIGATGVGVDATGRVVALWDDAPASSNTPVRVLAARSSSGSNPLNTYNQVAQRKGDQRCNTPKLVVSSSGDGLGSWACSTSSSGPVTGPRLARLTAPGS
jgi:hypothetical protein